MHFCSDVEQIKIELSIQFYMKAALSSVYHMSNCILIYTPLNIMNNIGQSTKKIMGLATGISSFHLWTAEYLKLVF